MTRTPPSLKGTSVFSHRGCQCIHFRCHNSEQGIKTYSILNSLRSAWTSLASWYILLMYWMICRYSSRTLESDNWAFFSRGAGLEITKKKTKQKLSIFFFLHTSCKWFNCWAWSFHSLSMSSNSGWATLGASRKSSKTLLHACQRFWSSISNRSYFGPCYIYVGNYKINYNHVWLETFPALISGKATLKINFAHNWGFRLPAVVAHKCLGPFHTSHAHVNFTGLE